MNRLTEEEWENLLFLIRDAGMERLALTVTMMCQKYLGLRKIVEEDESCPFEALKEYIMEKGNFGRKAGLDGRIAAFSLSSTEKGGFFRRLQAGGLSRWKAAKKYRILKPFAWIYQSFRIAGILLKNRMGIKEVALQREKGAEQRKLIEGLGLKMDRMISCQGDGSADNSSKLSRGRF